MTTLSPALRRRGRITVADDLTDLDRLLVDYVSAFLVGLGDESEIEAADSRHRYDRNSRPLLAAPNYTGADELGGTQRSFEFAIFALASTVCVEVSTCGETNVMRLVASEFPEASTISTGRFIFNWADF